MSRISYLLRPLLLGAVLIFGSFLMPVLFAADEEAAGTEVAAEPEQKNELTLLELVQKGGPLMYPLGICSIIALAIGLERFVSLRLGRVVPKRFIEGLKPFFFNGRTELEGALAYCEKSNSPMSRIILRGLHQSDRDIEHVEKAMEDGGLREIERLQRSIRGLAVIASIAPLMGLLGTVYGLIGAFQQADMAGAGKGELLANGIYQSLVSTAAGLTIALPVLLLYQFFNARIDRMTDKIDEGGNTFMRFYMQGDKGSKP